MANENDPSAHAQQLRQRIDIELLKLGKQDNPSDYDKYRKYALLTAGEFMERITKEYDQNTMGELSYGEHLNNLEMLLVLTAGAHSDQDFDALRCCVQLLDHSDSWRTIMVINETAQVLQSIGRVPAAEHIELAHVTAMGDLGWSFEHGSFDETLLAALKTMVVESPESVGFITGLIRKRGITNFDSLQNVLSEMESAGKPLEQGAL